MEKIGLHVYNIAILLSRYWPLASLASILAVTRSVNVVEATATVEIAVTVLLEAKETCSSQAQVFCSFNTQKYIAAQHELRLSLEPKPYTIITSAGLILDEASRVSLIVLPSIERFLFVITKCDRFN